MKLLKLLVLILFLSVPFVACNDKAEDVKPILNAEQTNFSFSSKGETQTLKIVCNTEWTITLSDGSWLTVSQTSGNGDCDVLLTAKENTQNTDRSVLLTLKTVNGSLPVYISISQERMEAFMKVSTKHLILGQYGFSEALDTVSSNYTCVVSSTPQWAKAEVDNKGVVKIRALENNVSSESRMGNVVIKANQLLDTIVVEQLPCIKTSTYVALEDPLVLCDNVVTDFSHNAPVYMLGINIAAKDEDAQMTDDDVMVKIISEKRLSDYQSIVENQPWALHLTTGKDFVVQLAAIDTNGKFYVNRYGYRAKPADSTAKVAVFGGAYDSEAASQGYPYVFNFVKNKYCSHYYFAAWKVKLEENDIPFAAWEMRKLIRQGELERYDKEDAFMFGKDVVTVLAWGEDDDKELGGSITYCYRIGTRSKASSQEPLYDMNTPFKTPGKDFLQSLDSHRTYKLYK